MECIFITFILINRVINLIKLVATINKMYLCDTH